MLELVCIEKSSFLKRLQFDIPSEVGVIKRPFVIDEPGTAGRSGQIERIKTIAFDFFKLRNN